MHRTCLLLCQGGLSSKIGHPSPCCFPSRKKMQLLLNNLSYFNHRLFLGLFYAKCGMWGDTFRFIAEPIPMKRELKHSVPFHISIGIFSNCRAYPDEKGIETKHYDPIIGERQTDCRAWFTFSRLLSSCKTSAELGTIQHLDICMDSHMQCIC